MYEVEIVAVRHVGSRMVERDSSRDLTNPKERGSLVLPTFRCVNAAKAWIREKVKSLREIWEGHGPLNRRKTETKVWKFTVLQKKTKEEIWAFVLELLEDGTMEEREEAEGEFA